MMQKKIEKKDRKICFVASSGGHYEQLLMLHPLMHEHQSFVITEKTDYIAIVEEVKTYYLIQVNRREKLFILKMIMNVFVSLKIFIIEKPDIIISTGVLATIPICLFSKICLKKLIYIESFAKVKSATLTGKLLYRFADQFYVQWSDMLNIYPKAIYKGGIY